MGDIQETFTEIPQECQSYLVQQCMVVQGIQDCTCAIPAILIS